MQMLSQELVVIIGKEILPFKELFNYFENNSFYQVLHFNSWNELLIPSNSPSGPFNTLSKGLSQGSITEFHLIASEASEFNQDVNQFLFLFKNNIQSFSVLKNQSDCQEIVNVLIRSRKEYKTVQPRSLAIDNENADTYSVPFNEWISVANQSVAERLILLLQCRGIEYLFANSGTDFTPIIEAVANLKLQNKLTLKIIQCPHENTSIAMAHGYFLISKRPQAVMAHVTVGSANIGLGIINARRSQIPMFIMAGRTPLYDKNPNFISSDASLSTKDVSIRTNFVQWGQESFDQSAMFREYTKWDYELRDGEYVEDVVDRGLSISSSFPQGPVYLTLPKETLCQKVSTPNIYKNSQQEPTEPNTVSKNTLRKILGLIAQAKNPLIVTADLGRHSGAVQVLEKIALKLHIGVIEFGKRNFFNLSTNHPYHLGFDPNTEIKNCDLLIAIECPVPFIPVFTNLNHPPMSISIGTNANFSDLPLRTFRSDLTASGHPELILKDLNEMIHDLNSELPQDLVYSEYLNHLPLQVVSSNQWQHQFSEQLSKIKNSIHHEIHQKHLNWKEKFQINKFKNNSNKNSNNNHKVKNIQTDINRDSNLEIQTITKTDLSFCLNKIIDNNWVIFNEYNLDPNVVDRTLPNSWFENSYASGLGWALGAGLGGKLANANQNVLIKKHSPIKPLNQMNRFHETAVQNY